MKHISVLALSAVLAIGVMPFSADAAALSPMHANGIATHNIAVMQHSAMLNAFNNFDGSLALAIGKRAKPAAAPETPVAPREDNTDKYGTMPTYGEYGDDGTVFKPGRSGGDPVMSTSNWADWQHTEDYAKFDDFHKVDSNYDILSVGFAAEPTEIKNGFAEFGGFGGVMLADEDSESIDLQETGEYVGLYRGYRLGDFNIQMAANVGALFNRAETTSGKNKFTNLWAGAAVNASYNIVTSETFTLQPGVFAAYTWIHTSGYKSDDGKHISVDDFSALELSPSLRAIIHIVDGWYGAFSGRYVFNFTDGGNVDIAGTSVPELDLKNYAEYGWTLEKNFERLNIAASINRRDGGRTGWTCGFHLRYVF